MICSSKDGPVLVGVNSAVLKRQTRGSLENTVLHITASMSFGFPSSHASLFSLRCLPKKSVYAVLPVAKAARSRKKNDGGEPIFYLYRSIISKANSKCSNSLTVLILLISECTHQA